MFLKVLIIGLALAANRAFTHLIFPYLAARNKGVRLPKSNAFTNAPLLKRTNINILNSYILKFHIGLAWLPSEVESVSHFTITLVPSAYMYKHQIFVSAN